MKIINLFKYLFKRNNMTYSDYAENFLTLKQKDFNEIMLMFPNFDFKLLKEIADMNLLYDDTTKEDLISYIIYLSVDPEGDYIDSVEVHQNQVTIYERLDLENVGILRQKVVDLLSNSNLSVEFI